MTFDFFNTSHLAFGSKLTKAFLQLDRLCTEAEENQESLNTIIEQYSQYVNRNYKAPFPTRPDAPCRTNEIFDIINDLNSIKYLRINEEGNLECAINLFKRVSNRFTVATGTTELKKGYASVLDSISNARPEREIQFTETYPSSGNFLFEFRIDEYNNINIVGDSKSYFIPGDFNHIVGMEYEKDVSTSSYTAEGNECIVCVGLGGSGNTIRRLTVKVDDTTKIDVGTKNGKNFGVVYLKPGQTLTGTMSRAFKVKYSSKVVPIPEPVEPPTTTFTYTGSDYDNQTVDSGSFNSYLNDNGTVTFSRVSGNLQPITMNFTCSDWSSVKSVSFGDIANTNVDLSRSYFKYRSVESAGYGFYRLSDSQPPYNFDVIGIRNYFGDKNFYLSLEFGNLSDTPTSVTLSNFSFEPDSNANQGDVL